MVFVYSERLLTERNKRHWNKENQLLENFMNKLFWEKSISSKLCMTYIHIYILGIAWEKKNIQGYEFLHTIFPFEGTKLYIYIYIYIK